MLRNLLTTAPLVERKASMDSLLYITSLMSLESEKAELRQILPLIENQSDLSDYAEKIKQMNSGCTGDKSRIAFHNPALLAHGIDES